METRRVTLDAENDALALDALYVLIDCMKRTPRLAEHDRKHLNDAYSRRITEEMFETGKSFGDVAGGALDFLSRPDGLDYVKSINNDLGRQCDIVSKCFIEYLDYGEIPAPHYPWRICIILRRMKMRDRESAFLEAWCKHFPSGYEGSVYAKLANRLAKMQQV